MAISSSVVRVNSSLVVLAAASAGNRSATVAIHTRGLDLIREKYPNFLIVIIGDASCGTQNQAIDLHSDRIRYPPRAAHKIDLLVQLKAGLLTACILSVRGYTDFRSKDQFDAEMI